jgi:hypothetical protein
MRPLDLGHLDIRNLVIVSKPGTRPKGGESKQSADYFDLPAKASAAAEHGVSPLVIRGLFGSARCFRHGRRVFEFRISNLRILAIGSR